MRIIIALSSAIFLSGCVTTVPVVDATVSHVDASYKIKGKYAFFIQTGGWHLDIKTDGITCFLQSFDADANAPYERLIKGLISENFESATFVNEELSESTIKEKHLDGQLIIYQGNANAKFMVNQGFWTYNVFSGVDIDATIALVSPGYQLKQVSVSGSGLSRTSVFSCSEAAEYVGAAVSMAIRDLSSKALLNIRDITRR